MRSMLVALTLAYGLLGMADFAFASVYGSGHIYVPGQIRDGIYIRPHFVAAPADASMTRQGAVLTRSSRRP